MRQVPILHRWGMAMARHRRLVLLVWAVLLVVCAAVFPKLESRLGGMDFVVQGSESQQMTEVLDQHFPQLGTESDVMVFRSQTSTADSSEFRAAVERAIARVQGVAGVRGVVTPYADPSGSLISADRRVAVAIVGLGGDMAERADAARQVQSRIAAGSGDLVEVGLTGYSAIQNDATAIQNSDLERAEMIGIPVALLLLILALGALVAAVVPIAVALSGLLLAVGAMFTLTTWLAFDSLVMAMATMIGIGVGIDYAMFVVSRFREELARSEVTSRGQREEIAIAVGRSLMTAGKTIIASGIVVMISLSALVVMRAPIFRGIAVGVATAVVATLLVSLTLLPALLAMLGPAVNRGALPERLRPAGITTVSPDQLRGRWARWAYAVMAKPVVFGAAAVVALAVAAAPIFGINYGLDMGVSALDDMPSGRAATALVDQFPAGALSPIQIAATGPGDAPLTPEQQGGVEEFLAGIARDDRVEAVLPTQENDGRLTVSAIATAPFDSIEAIDLVRDVRAKAAEAGRDGGPVVLVGGSTAEFVDLSDEMTSKLLWVIALVLGSSLLFLIIAFRSIALPIKAILMNLLATGAALGITVAVFQWGIGESVLGFTSTGFLQVYLPTVVFAVLFGLSMDYEVFLIRRIREYWESSGDNEYAVAAGLTRTARPITAAAAIMVIVFGSFVTAQVLELKQLGFTLAVAVALDAIVVRMVLVPALMRVMGRWNWWFPTGRTPTPTAARARARAASR